MPNRPSLSKQFFSGSVDESLIFPFPEMPLEEKEILSMMLSSIRDFFDQRVDSAQIDKNSQIPEDVLKGIKELGLFGLNIPASHGGIGLSMAGYCRIMEEIGALDASIAVTLGAHQSIGLKGLLLFGNTEQKQKYLPKLASGQFIAAFALTEPSAGSDAANIQTYATLSPDKKYYSLNGSKIWITNGAIADFFTVFAHTGKNDKGKPELTAFLVERSFGVSHGPNEHKLGIKGSATNAVYLDDVKVPVENVLGEVGQGFKIAMEILNHGRLGLSAVCLGGSKTLLKLSTQRALERKAFGKAIAEFDMIKEKIAQMSHRIFSLESMTYHAAGMISAKEIDFSIEAALCKIYGSEVLWFIANEVLQIAAGVGYMQEYPYERHLRDARIAMIFEGTNEILRSFVALVTLQEKGTQLKLIKSALKNPLYNLRVLSQYAIKKAKDLLPQTYISKAHPDLLSYCTLIGEWIHRLNIQVDSLLFKKGNKIINDQFSQMRIANIFILIYSVLSSLSRVSTMLGSIEKKSCEKELLLLEAVVHHANGQIENLFHEFSSPSDETHRQIADSVYQQFSAE